MIFRDRHEAGRALAQHLAPWNGRDDVVVLALPRGGVPVAYEVARALRAPLDLLLVRKLGVPGHEEYAMGAIASGGIRVLDEAVVQQMGIRSQDIERIAQAELAELERRRRAYAAGDRMPVRDRVAIVIDDGLATGSTLRAAAMALRQQHPAHIVIAVPVGDRERCDSLRAVADEVICIATPDPLYGVGGWYRDFTQVEDREVTELLAAAAREYPPSGFARQLTQHDQGTRPH